MVCLVAAGCGHSGPSSADRQKAANEFAMALGQMNEHMTESSDLGPALEAAARVTLLEDDTQHLVALARDWSDRGLADNVVSRPLVDAAAMLEGICPQCVAQLDRERAAYG